MTNFNIMELDPDVASTKSPYHSLRKISLLDQPNEILSAIVSLLPNNEFVSFQDTDGKQQVLSQRLVFTQVSRRLRICAHEADFWHDRSFCFSDLVSSKDASNEGLCVGRLTRALLTDSHFVDCLKRKKSWIFRHIDAFFAVIQCGSWFHQNAEEVEFMEMDGFHIAVARLGKCRSLKTLSIKLGEDPEDCIEAVDLDIISKACPSLNSLSLEGLELCHGSLTCASLRNLVVAFADGTGMLNLYLIPLRSKDTLQNLTLFNFRSIQTDIPESFDGFTRLTHLTCDPLRPDLCHLLTATNVKLSSFTAFLPIIKPHGNIYGDIPLDIFANLLSAASLSGLQTLNLTFEGSSFPLTSKSYLEQTAPRIHAVTCMENLQHLRLEAGFDIIWVSMFANMSNLKSLEWIIFEEYFGWTVLGEYFDHTEFHKLAELKEWNFSADELLEDIVYRIERWFDEVFVKFPEQPSVDVYFDNQPRHWK